MARGLKLAGRADDWRPPSHWHWSYRALLYTGSVLAGIAASLAVARFLFIPLASFLVPELETYFYDIALYGVVPVDRYVSFERTSPRMNVVQWHPSCEEGYTLLGWRGQQVPDPGPLILDGQGDLVWSGGPEHDADNVKIQRYRGQDYLTFWGGERAGESGQGKYYMLDNTYKLRHTVSAVGEGLFGDMHEFKLTEDGTALITIFDRISADPNVPSFASTEAEVIIDAIVQEIDVATGDLLFEWRASDHVTDAHLNYTKNLYPTDGVSDYFHINSVDRDSKGNFLISLRHQWQILYVDGQSGEIIWTLGGESEDFEDLSGGSALAFQWQHDVRWVDEDTGVISLFNNDVTHNYFASADTHSRGMILQIDAARGTVVLLHEYSSMDHLADPSMGSMQVLPQTEDGEQHVMVGWGAAGAFSEFDIAGELLCEVHFTPAILWYFEPGKSYRAIKVPKWNAVPADWDPVLKSRGESLYVSWNGATTVHSWVLQGSLPTPGSEYDDESLRFTDVDVTPKEGFESSFELLRPKDHGQYRVAALDIHGSVIRYSNVVDRPSSFTEQYALAIIVVAAIFAVFAVLALRHRKLLCRRSQSRDTIKYQRVELDQR